MPASHAALGGLTALMIAPPSLLPQALLQVYDGEHGGEFEGQGKEQYKGLYCLTSSILSPP